MSERIQPPVPRTQSKIDKLLSGLLRLPQNMNSVFSEQQGIVTVADDRSLQYCPRLINHISRASAYDATSSHVMTFADQSQKSTISEVVNFSKRDITKALVVGWLTVPFADKASWLVGNINSLLHNRPGWVKDLCVAIPHFEGRSDRDAVPGEAVQAQMYADWITTEGKAARNFTVLSLDDHSFRTDEYFRDGHCEHISATSNRLMAQALAQDGLIGKDTVIAGPDIGSAGRAYDLSKKAAALIGEKDLPLIILEKTRNLDGVNESRCSGVLKDADIRGKTVIIRDDIGDSLATLIRATKELKERGADKVVFVYTHAVHSDKQIKEGEKMDEFIDCATAEAKLDRAVAMGLIDGVYITDSRPLTWETQKPYIRVLPIGELLGNISRSVLQQGVEEARRAFAADIFQPIHPHKELERIENEICDSETKQRATVRIFDSLLHSRKGLRQKALGTTTLN